MLFDRDDNWTGCHEHDGRHSVLRDADGPEPCDDGQAAFAAEPTPQPNELLIELEASIDGLTVGELADLTGYSDQVVADDLLRLEDKGLARPVRDERGAYWIDLLRFVPPASATARTAAA